MLRVDAVVQLLTLPSAASRVEHQSTYSALRVVSTHLLCRLWAVAGGRVGSIDAARRVLTECLRYSVRTRLAAIR